MDQSLGLQLDQSRDEPLYRQLFDQVVARIQMGALPIGYRLPATRALADDLGTHRNTVVHAYALLRAAGFITATVGRGSFVAPARKQPPAPSSPPRSGLPWDSLLSRAAQSEPLARAGRLAQGIGKMAAINLTQLQPSEDLLPADLLRRCTDHVLRTQGPRALGYTEPAGVSRLREQVADDMRRRGVPGNADDIIITTGSQQALDLVVRALVDPGDTVLIDETTYAGAINLFSAGGAHLVSVRSDADGPETAALEHMARSGAKALYLMPNSNNPTGACISATRRAEIVEWSRRTGIPIVEDDYAADLALGDDPLPAPMRALDGDVIHIGTFSKRLIPALRIGYVQCPRPLYGRVLALKHALDLGTSTLLQYALAEFLERGYLRAHVTRIVGEYRRRRDALEQSLAEHLPSEVTWRRPECGVTLWIPLRPPLTPEAVFEEAHRHGVLVSPSSLNGVGSDHPGGIRLAFCSQPIEQLAEGGRRLGAALHALVGRARGIGKSSPAPTLGIV